MRLAIDTAAARWLADARAEAWQPPRQPRLPLVLAGVPVGSVAEGVLDEIAFQGLQDGRYVLLKEERGTGLAWHLDAPGPEATPALNALAEALRAQGCAGPWRNEPLAVCNPQGEPIATIERGLVRVLGIATRAVHLVGLAPCGRMWLQLRAQTKPNNPGMWDTLMGGMVSAADTVPQALERETWEEAGLRLSALQDMAHGGSLVFSRPSREGGGVGYMVERIDWFRCAVPEGVEPCNQDGEVERFELASVDGVGERLGAGLFTLEAGLVVGACCGG
ncbi:MAG: NUDIX domain-containing protein [Burkholderiaceae bacterium]|nr:NUDIX domain-containing protein [Burkholderiaceae bacterium]